LSRYWNKRYNAHVQECGGLSRVEASAMLRVLEIVHVAMTVPTRWLSEKTQDLSKYDYCLEGMGLCVDLLETVFLEISKD
jgi:hypothetical protein